MQTELKCLLNDLGDVYALEHPDGTIEEVDPSTWGWLSEGGANAPEERRSVDSLLNLPWFSYVTERLPLRFVPGPKTSRHSWMEWPEREAPPAHYSSSGGAGGYFNRVSEAAGFVADRLPVQAAGATMTIYDFVRGLTYAVSYEPPPDLRVSGCVYVLDDGFGIKVGYTAQESVATRIAQLQTGNPRRILPLAEVHSTLEDTEFVVHRALADLNIGGEWFDRQRTIRRMATMGTVKQWLSSVTGIDEQNVHVHPPYR